MKTQVMKAVLGMVVLCGVSTSHAGGGQIGSAGNGSHLLTGRLIESTCNTNMGIADVKVIVVDNETQEVNYMALNLVNDKLCTTNKQIFGQPITDMAFYSVMGTDDGVSEKAQLQQFTVNEYGIATDVKQVLAEGPLLKTYRSFNLLNLNAYHQIDKRYLEVDMFNGDDPNDPRMAVAKKILEMGKVKSLNQD